MKGRVGGVNGGGPPTELLVCFPSRARLTLMPKPICSPSRPTDPSKRHHHHHHKSSPLFRTTTKSSLNNKTQIGSDQIGSEPTSPKVTCAGQIKVRPKIRTSPRPDAKNWLESVGLKKDVMNFLGALRSLRFNMHCFGSFHGSVGCSSEEEEEEEEEVGGAQSRTIFSKWFVVLEENQEQGDESKKEIVEEEEEEEEEGGGSDSSVAPKNALLLMRCRSAPAKGWLEGEGEGGEVVRKQEVKKKGNEERLMLMSYAPDFFKVSTEIANETWVVGSVDPLARSRSWKR